MVTSKRDVINFLLDRKVLRNGKPMSRSEATAYVEAAKERKPRRTYAQMQQEISAVLIPKAPVNTLSSLVREPVPIAPSFSKFMNIIRKQDSVIPMKVGARQDRFELPLRKLIINPDPEDIERMNQIYRTFLFKKITKENFTFGFRYMLIGKPGDEDYSDYNPDTYYEAKAKNPLVTSFQDYLGLNRSIKVYRRPFSKTGQTKESKVKEIGDYLMGQYGNPYQDIMILSLFADEITRKEGGQGGQTFTQITEKYMIISPESRTNCLFTSVAIGMKWSIKREMLDDKTSQNAQGKELKRQVNPSITNYSDDNTIQEICDKKKITIIKFNNIFEKKEFNPISGKSKTIIKIQLSDGHFVAMIKKKDITAKYPDFEFKVKVEEPKYEVPQMIRKTAAKEQGEEFDEHKYVAWDFETVQDNGNHKPYKVGISYYLSGQERCKIFTGLDCAQQLMKFIAKNIEFFNDKYFYAHNGGKFDLNILIKEALLADEKFKIDGKGCVELNNAWIGFRLRYEDKVLEFRDSFRMFMGSLDNICKDLKVKHQKLVGSVEYHKINKDNFREFDEVVDKYLTNDCLGLLEALTIFGKKLFEDTGIHLYTCMTSATLAKKSFYKKHYNPEKTPLYTMPTEMDQFVRDGYFGGMVQCFDIGYSQGKFYYYDFTSLYPSEGRKALPYGKPVWKHGSEINLKSFYGFVKCRVSGTKEMLKGARPIHAVKTEGKLVFAYVQDKEMTLFSEEIKYGMTLGYKYIPIKGIEFKAEKYLKPCFEDAFQRKAKAESEGNAALVAAYKIIANSTYGFFGMKKNDRDGVIIGEDVFINKYLDEGKLNGYGKIGNYDVVRIIKDLNLRDINVGVSAAISSYSRMKTHQLINDIEKKGYKVHYCDTDSVITTMPINMFEDIQAKYQWDKTGNELGSVKNECIKKVKGKIGVEGLTKQTEIDGELYFDELRIVGCKAYSLSKKLYTGAVISINKLKGYSQRDFFDDMGVEHCYSLTVGDFDKMICGGSIEQVNMQFSCNKQAMLNENSSFDVSTRFIKKKFRLTYNKGKLETSIDEKNRFVKVEHMLICA